MLVVWCFIHEFLANPLCTPPQKPPSVRPRAIMLVCEYVCLYLILFFILNLVEIMLDALFSVLCKKKKRTVNISKPTNIIRSWSTVCPKFVRRYEKIALSTV